MQNYDLKSLFPTYSVIEGLKVSTDKLTISYPEYDKMLQKRLDMSNNIISLSNVMGASLDNDILDNDILDTMGNLKTAGRLVDVARQDVQNILIQQNTIYMIGTMTIATLLITAILISKK